MLITFTVKDNKITHDLGDQMLVAGAVGEVQATFDFDSTWEGFDIVAVFSSSGKRCGVNKPVRFRGEPVDIPADALRAGKMYVSVVGFGPNDRKKTTQKWDIQQAITVQECGAMGTCDLLKSMVQEVKESDVAADQDVEKMLDNVFGDGGSAEDPAEPSEPSEPSVSEEDVASDEDVNQMLNSVFGASTP